MRAWGGGIALWVTAAPVGTESAMAGAWLYCCCLAAVLVSSVDAKTSKAVVIAPNIEQIESEGGLDDRINAIIKDAKENEIPIVFALTKKRIGRALRMKEISVVSVLDYSGADEEFKSTLKHAAEGRELYAKTLRA